MFVLRRRTVALIVEARKLVLDDIAQSDVHVDMAAIRLRAPRRYTDMSPCHNRSGALRRRSCPPEALTKTERHRHLAMIPTVGR